MAAVKAFARALKIEFETKPGDSPYDPEFVKKIKEGREDVKNGKGVRLAVEDL